MLNSQRRIRIPYLGKREYVRLSQQIRPIYDLGEKGLWYIAPPKRLYHQMSFPEEFLVYIELERKVGLICELAELKTYHQYGFDRRFHPKLGEIYAQIPKHLLPHTIGFRVIYVPNQPYGSFEKEAYEAGFLVAKTVLYGKL